MRFAVFVAASLVAACALLAPRPLPPEVSLESMTAAIIDAGGAHARARFAVHNPNGYDLAVKSFDYQFRVDGRQAGAGALAQPVTLAANAVTSVDIDLQVDFRAMAAALDHARRQGKLPYEINGSVVLENGMRLAFRKLGEFETSGGIRGQ